MRPLRTGVGKLELRFGNALYAAGVRDVTASVRVLYRTENAMVVELHEAEQGSAARMAVIEDLSWTWLRAVLPSSAPDRREGVLQACIEGAMRRLWAADC